MQNKLFACANVLLHGPHVVAASQNELCQWRKAWQTQLARRYPLLLKSQLITCDILARGQTVTLGQGERHQRFVHKLRCEHGILEQQSSLCLFLGGEVIIITNA
jgi:hypothetical protein